MTSELKVDKVSPATGTSTTLGDSGDTFTVPSGVTLDTSSSTLTLPSSVITGQTEKTSLVDADKFLISDSAASGALKYVQNSNLGGGGLVLLSQVDADQGAASSVEFNQVFSSDYKHYRLLGCMNIGSASAHEIKFVWRNSSNTDQTAGQYFGSFAGSRRIVTGSADVTGGDYGNANLDLAQDVYGGNYARKVTLDMTLFPDAYSSVTYTACQWQIGFYKYNSGTEAPTFLNGYGSYAQTTDLSGGGFKIYLNANSWDFVNLALYGVKTT